jgi:hypothetical protein
MSENSSAALAIILYFIDEEYSASHPKILENPFIERTYSEEVLQLAMKNKVSYCFAKRVLEEQPNISGKLKAIVELGEKNFAKVKETLTFATSLFTETDLDFLVIKSLKSIPSITEDIDFIMKERNYKLAAYALENSGAIKTDGRFINVILNLRLGVPDYKFKELLKLDLYKTVPYPGLKCFDEEFLWKNPRYAEICGVRCLIPSPEADLLIVVASTFFADAKFTMLDFLHINSLLKNNLNLEEVLEQTRKYGWSTQFLQLISKLQSMQRRLYESKFIPTDIVFPYEAPLSPILSSLYGLVRFRARQDPVSIASTLWRVGFHSIFSRVYVATFYKLLKPK